MGGYLPLSKSTLAVLALLAVQAAATRGETITVVGWNLDSNRRSLGSLSDRFAAVGPVDVWALSGVSERWLENLVELTAAGSGAEEYAFVRLHGGLGDEVIFYDPRRFVLASHCQLDEVRPTVGGSRVPLVAHLRLESGLEVQIAAVHLYGTSSQIDEDERYQQMQRFTRWAGRAAGPVIAAGDFNAEWSFDGDEGSASRELRELTEDGAFEWIRPEVLVPTACDARYPGVRHHVFAAGAAQDWTARAEILLRDDGYCAGGKDVGHRPVRAVFELP